MAGKGAPETVLVYSGEDISGDGLIKLPFIGGLRAAFPASRITWCAASGRSVYAGWLAPVVEGLIDEVLLDGRPGLQPLDWIATQRPFGGRTFDLVIDTQAKLSMTLAARRGAGRGGRFISSAARFALSSVRPREPWPVAMSDQLALLLRLAGGETARPVPIRLTDKRLLDAARSLLPDGPIYVGIGPGAGGADRRWPIERYVEVARRQWERGRTPVFVLGPAELDYIPILRQTAPFVLLPGVDLDEALRDVDSPLLTIALAGRMAAAVAADAGPGHMLAAGGAPLVSLFCEPRKLAKFRPASPRLEPLIAEDFGGKEIDRIPVDAVDAALERLLAASTAL